MTADELERALSRTAPPPDPQAAAAAARRAAARAGEAGAADVAYALEPSPLGDLLVAVTARGLVNLSHSWEFIGKLRLPLDHRGGGQVRARAEHELRRA